MAKSCGHTSLTFYTPIYCPVLCARIFDAHRKCFQMLEKCQIFVVLRFLHCPHKTQQANKRTGWLAGWLSRLKVGLRVFFLWSCQRSSGKAHGHELRRLNGRIEPRAGGRHRRRSHHGCMHVHGIGHHGHGHGHGHPGAAVHHRGHAVRRHGHHIYKLLALRCLHADGELLQLWCHGNNSWNGWHLLNGYNSSRGRGMIERNCGALLDSVFLARFFGGVDVDNERN